MSHADELITREQVIGCLWEEPQLVDVSNGINTAINRLRGALGDNPAEPAYIETVIRAGYRFIAKVQWVEAEAALEKSGPVQRSGSAATAAVNASAGMVVLPSPEIHETEVAAQPDAIVTGYRLSSPSKTSSKKRPSPAGQLRVLLAGFLLLLVACALEVYRARVLRPRAAAPGALVFTQATFDEGTDAVTAESVSPDGRFLAFSDQQGLTVRLISRSYDRLLPLPPSFKVTNLAWQGRSAGLLVSGEDSHGNAQVWSVGLSSPARLLLDNAAEAVMSRDNTLACTRSDGAEVWVTQAGNAHPRRVDNAVGGQFRHLVWAPDGQTLLAQQRRVRDLQQADSPDQRESRWVSVFFDTHSGKAIALVEDLRFDSAVFLPDGRLLFVENSASGAQLRVVAADAGRGRVWLPSQVVSEFRTGRAAHLSVSADGALIGAVLDGQSSQIVYGDLQSRPPYLTNIGRLHHGAQENFPHAWTPASDAIVFESNDLGSYAIYKQKIDGSPAELLARSSANSVLPKVTPDGKWILFEEFRSLPSPRVQDILRVPVSGGRTELVPTHGDIEGFACSLSARGKCIVREWVGSTLIYYELDPVRGQGAKLAQTGWTETSVGDWSISPDGGQVLTVTHDPSRPGIRIIGLGAARQSLREVPISGFGEVTGVCETEDSSRYLVSAHMTGAYVLVVADKKGHATSLREQPTPLWGVPSRTGKIAFDSPTRSVNVLLASSGRN